MNKTDTKENVVATLNHLIEICKDGQQGFKDAADHLQNKELGISCLQYSKQREQFAKELQNEVNSMKGDAAETSGTVAGTIHRGWLNLKAAITANDDDAIIAECERGEDAAKDAYEKALKSYLSPALTGLVQRQYQDVLAVHDRFSALQKQATH